MHLRAPDDLGALIDVPGLNIIGCIADITQTPSLTILHLENNETVWLPKETSCYLDPAAQHVIECDADRRHVLTSSTELFTISPTVVLPPATPVPDELVELSVIEQLDEPWPCQVRKMLFIPTIGTIPLEARCRKPAHWILTCKNCGDTTLCCNEHLPYVMQAANVTCPACFTDADRGSDLYQFTPLETNR